MDTLDVERLERNERILSDAPPRELDMLDVWLQRWGLPPTAPLALLYAPSEAFTEPATGYRTESVFSPCDSFRAWQCPWKYRLPTIVADEVLVKHLRGISWPDDDADVPLIEVRVRIWKPGTSTFAEARLDPVTWATHIDIRDLDEHAMSTPKSLRVLLDALRIHIANKPGPEPGSITYPDRDDFLARCVQAVNSIIEHDHELRTSRITKVRVANANALGIHPKTLRNHLIHHRLPTNWNAFRAFLLKLEGINQM